MSFLRTQSSLRVSRFYNQAPRSVKCLSQTSSRRVGEPNPKDIPDVAAMQSTEDQASMISLPAEDEPTLATVIPTHHPDYTARTDHGTSNFSPVPKRVMDGSEPGEVTPAAVLSGAPIDLQARAVRIYKPAKPAWQSGSWGSHLWRIDWDPLPKGNRWENPLMGWQSTGDIMSGTKLTFNTKEEAIAFAQKQGYEYYVAEPQQRRVVPKAYANNFIYESGPLKHIKTK